MVFFTGKGDDGTTSLYGEGGRMSKASVRAEALGTVDELNSFLGSCKVTAINYGEKVPVGTGVVSVGEIIHRVQKDLFIIQAELGGAEKTIAEEKVDLIEDEINAIEESMPPLSSFSIPGGTALATNLDTARAIARRAERRVVEANLLDDGTLVGEYTLAYLNRLSSLLFALARVVNHNAGVNEEAPDYR